MKSVFIACAAAVAILVGAVSARERGGAGGDTITVRIVDEHGAPMAGVEVGSMAFGSGSENENKALELGFYGQKKEPLHVSGPSRAKVAMMTWLPACVPSISARL